MLCHTLLLVFALLCLFRNYFLFIRYTKQPVLSFAFAVRCAQTTLFREFLKTKEVFFKFNDTFQLYNETSKQKFITVA